MKRKLLKVGISVVCVVAVAIAIFVTLNKLRIGNNIRLHKEYGAITEEYSKWFGAIRSDEDVESGLVKLDDLNSKLKGWRERSKEIKAFYNDDVDYRRLSRAAEDSLMASFKSWIASDDISFGEKERVVGRLPEKGLLVFQGEGGPSEDELRGWIQERWFYYSRDVKANRRMESDG